MCSGFSIASRRSGLMSLGRADRSSINATFGFASWTPGYDSRLLLTLADDALYRQKLQNSSRACTLESRNTALNLAIPA